MRRVIARSVVIALLLIVTGWVLPTSARAASTPWTWVSATGGGVSASNEAVFTATCPAGYRAVTGGVDQGNSFIRWETAVGPNFSVDVYYASGVQVTVRASCALSSQVAVQVVDRTLVMNSTDQFGGPLGLGDFACGGGLTPLNASLTWNSGGAWVSQSGPETIGGTNEWFVVALGNSASDVMRVELLCVANADLSGANWVTASQTAGSQETTETVVATCPDQQRFVTGGEHIGSRFAYDVRTYPVGAQAWTTVALVPTHDTLSVAVLCVPDGDPVANFTSGPPNPTNSTTATFTFTAVDPADASPATNWCFLNTNFLGSCNGSYTVTGLTEGQNVFSIEAVTPTDAAVRPPKRTCSSRLTSPRRPLPSRHYRCSRWVAR